MPGGRGAGQASRTSTPAPALPPALAAALHPRQPTRTHHTLQVGRPCADAKAAIEAELPGMHVFQVPEHSMVTMDYRTDRVRIFCSQGGTVAAMPRIG